MSDFGGFGGLENRREIDPDDLFEAMVARVFGDRMKTDDKLCREIWSSLANIEWKHANGDTAGYSLRAAGDMIAAIRGAGGYMEWYCSGPDGLVSDEIEKAFAREGWTGCAMDEEEAGQ